MKALVVLLCGLAPCAQVHPLQELIEAARADNHARLKTLLAGGLPGLKGRDGAAVWGAGFSVRGRVGANGYGVDRSSATGGDAARRGH